MILRHADRFYENEQDRQLARVISILIWASWGTFVFVILTNLYYGDWRSVAATVVSGALLIVPWALLRWRHLRASSLVVVLIVLGSVTALATVGQGIRDLAIVAYPIVLIFAGLTLDRAWFRVCVGLNLAGVIWLVVGENFGWFVPQPFDGVNSNWFYLLGVTIILLVAALAVELLATNVRTNLELAHQEIARRNRAEDQLRFQGTHDSLTGIYNRAFFVEELARLEHSRDFPVSVIVADVDGLKSVNDTRGHAVGDELLRRTANLLHSVFRQSDVLTRIGGDEFAVLLPATDQATVEQIVSRIREQEAVHNVLHSDLNVEMSIGAATAAADKLTEALIQADHRMYADKAARQSKHPPSTAV